MIIPAKEYGIKEKRTCRRSQSASNGMVKVCRDFLCPHASSYTVIQSYQRVLFIVFCDSVNKLKIL